MEFAVTVGEWCIERRAFSSVLILVLMGALAGAFTYQLERSKREHLLRQNFNNWLTVAERFVQKDSATKWEKDEYKLVDEYWKHDFTKIIDLPMGYKHPALYLHQTMELRNNYEAQGSFQDSLPVLLPELLKIMDNCRATLRPPEKRSPDENRAWDLLNIHMGRIYNRVAESLLYKAPPTERCDECETAQRTALAYFKAVDLQKYANTDYANTYVSAVRNGQGTIYSNIFSASLLSHRNIKTDDVCGGDAIMCAVAALQKYRESKNGFASCSFQDVRHLNNVIDLISRIAIVYPQVVDKSPALQNEPWMQNRSVMAANLEGLIKELMSCNANGVSLPYVFVTSAQGYAAAASLEPENESLTQRRLKSSGTYIKIAHSYEPKNIKDWELFYFCRDVNGNDLDLAAFRDEVSRPDGLQVDKANILTNEIDKQCQRVRSPQQSPVIAKTKH